MRGRWTGAIAPALALLVLLAAAACGGADDGEVTPTATEAPNETATVTAPSTQTASPESPTATATPTPEQPTPQPGEPTPDNSIVVACGDILAPLDKQHRLSSDCAPPDLVTLPGEMVSSAGQQLRAAAAEAFMELFSAAQGDGYTILAASSYRSYQTQVVTYNGHVSRLGQEQADRVSARPGHSEHQLGTTTDVTSASAGYSLEGFRGTPEAEWLLENSWKYGFIVSYPEGKEHITGYVWEPWHIRWIGKAEAQKVHESGLTLHEYLLR